VHSYTPNLGCELACMVAGVETTVILDESELSDGGLHGISGQEVSKDWGRPHDGSS